MSALGHDDGCGSHGVRQLDPSLAAATSQCPHHIQRIPLLGSGPVAGWAGWAGWGWADASPGTVRVTRTTHGTVAPVARGAFPPAQTTSAPPAAGTTYFLLIYRVHAEFIVFYIEHVCQHSYSI